MITSGSVFAFDEDESGIKRWMDSFFWSPFHILINFLLYRGIDKCGVVPAVPTRLGRNRANTCQSALYVRELYVREYIFAVSASWLSQYISLRCLTEWTQKQHNGIR